MVSAERVMEYGQLQSEPPLETVPSYKKPPPNWPDKGGIEVDEVSFRYADDLPLVLKSLSFSVNPAQKVSNKWDLTYNLSHTVIECND